MFPDTCNHPKTQAMAMRSFAPRDAAQAVYSLKLVFVGITITAANSYLVRSIIRAFAPRIAKVCNLSSFFITSCFDANTLALRNSCTMSTEYTPDINMEGEIQDDSYTSQMNEPIPVQGDNRRVEDPVNASSADSDQQLGKYHTPE